MILHVKPVFLARCLVVAVYATSCLPPLSDDSYGSLGAADLEIKDFTAIAVDGKEWRFSHDEQTDFTVVAFLGAECPLAAIYAVKLEELNQEFHKSPIRVVAIMSNWQDDLAEVRTFVRESKLTFPVIHDQDGKLADLFHATRTPEFFIVNGSGTVRYHGRFDDQFSRGAKRDAPLREHLKLALNELLAGRPVTVAETETVGCIIGRKPRESEATATGKRVDRAVTFVDVAPVLHRNCASCHRKGQVAPFGMEEYHDVAGWAETMKELVVERRMPPWDVSPASPPMKNDLRLSAEEIALISAWADAGAPAGDLSRVPPFPDFAAGWQLGEPDLVITLPEFVAPPGTNDYFPTLQATVPLDGERWIRAFEILPSNPEIMHHVGVVFGPETLLGMSGDTERRSSSSKDSSPVPGSIRDRIRAPMRQGLLERMQRGAGDGNNLLTRLGLDPAELMRGRFGFLGAIAAGTPPREFPPGFGVPIKPINGNVTFSGMMHYHPTVNTVERDQTRIGLYFGEGPLKHIVKFGSTGFAPIDIAPGDEAYVTRNFWTAPEDILLITYSPHMHYRGKSMTLLAHRPDGTTDVLVSVPRYDFNYQWTYDPQTIPLLPQGTRIEAIGTLDNSRSNEFNPDPTVRVQLGPNSTDEMAVGLFLYATAQTAHRRETLSPEMVLDDWMQRNADDPALQDAVLYRGTTPGFGEQSPALLILQPRAASKLVLISRYTTYEIDLGRLDFKGTKFSQPGFTSGYGDITVEGAVSQNKQSATATIKARQELKNPIHSAWAKGLQFTGTEVQR